MIQLKDCKQDTFAFLELWIQTDDILFLRVEQPSADKPAFTRVGFKSGRDSHVVYDTPTEIMNKIKH